MNCVRAGLRTQTTVTKRNDGDIFKIATFFYQRHKELTNENLHYINR